MHIHLDPVGGISGDMFAGAILDMRPDLEPGLVAALAALGLERAITVRRVDRTDGVLAGSGFDVAGTELAGEPPHAHTHHSQIRTLIEGAGLSSGVKARALDIFQRLASVEARVHGVPIDDVAFHEVGALDSIVDIVAASVLIETLGADSWSVAAIPMGSGRTKSQHGTLPLPAPATLRLLEGMRLFDDGIPGERVTPTGAAILAHLQPTQGGPKQPMRLAGSGTGFGTKRFDGVPNILRVMAFDAAEDSHTDWVSMLSFEIDDQSPEDLAVGLDAIRDEPGVVDVSSFTISGKKGRIGFSVRVLCDPATENAAIAACFQQTTTLGIRRQTVERCILDRRSVTRDGIGVKIAERPDGRTAKAEMDDISRTAVGHDARQMLAADACAKALQEDGSDP